MERSAHLPQFEYGRQPSVESGCQGLEPAPDDYSLVGTPELSGTIVGAFGSLTDHPVFGPTDSGLLGSRGSLSGGVRIP